MWTPGRGGEDQQGASCGEQADEAVQQSESSGEPAFELEAKEHLDTANHAKEVEAILGESTESVVGEYTTLFDEAEEEEDQCADCSGYAGLGPHILEQHAALVVGTNILEVEKVVLGDVQANDARLDKVVGVSKS